MVALTLIKTWWKEIALVLVLLAAYGYWSHLTSSIERLKLSNDNLTLVNEVLTTNVTTLEQAIKTNNDAIQTLSASASKTNSDFAKLNTTVATQIAALSPKLTAILNGTKPVTCEDTVKYLLDARREYP